MIKNSKKTVTNVQRLTFLALMTALVVVLQLYVRIPIGMFSINMSLVPIVIGAAMLGPMAGGWLGLVSAVTILLSGDAAPFWAVNQIGTVVTVIAKGILSGWVSGVIYKLVEKKSSLAAIISSSFACPIVNTGAFTLLGFVFFFNKFMGEAANEGKNVMLYFIIVYIGWNFVIEVVTTTLLSPVVHRIVKLGNRILSSKHSGE